MNGLARGTYFNSLESRAITQYLATPKKYLMKHFHLLLFCIAALAVQAQNIQRESMQVEYISRPSEPLPNGVSSYEVTVAQVYKDVYQDELAQWEIDTKVAQENYDKEMEAYNAKGTGAKLLERALLDEKKPALRLPAKPVRTEKIFEANIVGSKINMEGMTRAAGGAVVNLEIQQFETMPYEDQKQEIKAKDGSVSYKYYRTMQYRQLVGVSLSLPDGSVVADEVMGDQVLYSTFTSNKYASKSALNKSWNQTSINDRLSMTAVQSAADAANKMLNDRFCFSTKKRPMTIYHAKTTKKVNYTDLNNAAFDMEIAMEKYLSDQAASMAGIAKCAEVWTTALAEADFDNKKARIDAKVAGLLYINLINANIWLEQYDEVDRLFDQMRRVPTKRGAEGTEEGLDTFSEEQRRRKEANS